MAVFELLALGGLVAGIAVLAAVAGVVLLTLKLVFWVVLLLTLPIT